MRRLSEIRGDIVRFQINRCQKSCCVAGKRGTDLMLWVKKLLRFYQAMPCPLCSHDKTHKQGFNKLMLSTILLPKLSANIHAEEQVRIILRADCKATSLRDISRVSGLSYNTGVSLIRAGSQKAQLIHSKSVVALSLSPPEDLLHTARSLFRDQSYPFLARDLEPFLPYKAMRQHWLYNSRSCLYHQ
jgi:hypothetical protein